jgi:methylated-DNA-[protein]-cysteine S-methyltransferase
MTYGDIAKRLGGEPGGFSANGGVVTKLKMLAIEGAAVNHTPNLFD